MELIKARVIIVHRDRYKIDLNGKIVEAEISGSLRYSAEETSDFPVVGDYVNVQHFDNEFCIIQSIDDRRSTISRKSVSSDRNLQIIASNIDIAFVAQSVDHDYNLHRLDRYITALYDGKIEPIILLTKIDLVDQEILNEIKQEIDYRYPHVKIIVISTLTNQGLDDINQLIEKDKTYCILGSSGVGKSTLINHLLGEDYFNTKEISESTAKGMHTTTHRELVKLENGAFFIDTPGMREFGMGDIHEGLDLAFAKIAELSKSCKFSDCTHEKEPNCAVQEAIENEELDIDYFKEYKKLQREVERFSQSKAEKRAKDKSLGKFYREHINHKKNTRGF